MNSIVATIFLCIFLFGFAHSHTASTESIMQVIKSWGYPAENYTANTPDGWALSLIRIPYGKNGTTPRKGVFFFQHGVTDCAAGSILNLPYESFPYILADAGFDVWLGNNRGNGVSMTYKYATPDQEKFWDFTWDDMATYDFPTQVDFILKFTNSSKLSIAGHSQGTVQIFASLIDNPALAKKFHIYIAFAPIAYVHHVGDIAIRHLSVLPDKLLYDILGRKAFEVGTVVHEVLPDFCKEFPSFCTYEVDLVCGPTEYWNATRVPFYLGYEPNPTSVKDMIHWVQEVRQQKFQKYDYGSPEENMKHYNQTTPPQYDLSKYPSDLPTALFTGGKDFFADPTDVALLVKQINNPVQIYYQREYAHLDPLLGYEAWKLTYPHVRALLDKYGSDR